ncbi:MAG TPA: aminotransferase class V-fold PLP-dependent enzyme [Pyrinomonadaceae bacterium]|nr:aminotransferase class V-fold PLP-dependent enzyme [Pyrinomonadaceae bacterium]
MRKSTLELSSAELRALAASVNDLVLEYFSEVSNLPVFPVTTGGQTAAVIGSSLPDEGVELDQLIQDCRTIIENSRQNGHPRFFGYVASPATAPGAFADLIASALNVNVTSWRSGPSATEVERTVICWLGSMIGYNSNSHGLLTSGGSMANLTALLIAQRSKSATNDRQAGLWRADGPMTVYASTEVHLSIPKAADILGFGRDNVRLIECDDAFRIDVRRLRERLRADIGAGMKPFCVVGSAGTTNTGAVDPLSEIADVANEFSLWFHVDGAYGAPAAMDESKRSLFTGLERADSVSLDAHKWLYAPLDCGCLLFRDPAKARAAFGNEDADYIKVLEQEDDEAFAFWNYGPELSRRFRALKLWWTLRYFGVKRIAAAITEDNELASYLADLITAADDFELLSKPQLSICCFRYLPHKLRQVNDGELNDLNSRIMHAVQRGGHAYLSSATINDKFALRICITNFRTTRADMDQTLDVIRDVAAKISNGDN